MDQLKAILERLSLRQKITIAIVALAVVGGLTYGMKWNKERDLRPLYTNVAAEDAGAITEKLKAGNVEYKVADNGTILVPSARVAELRIEMASAGLPRTGRIGFELFDKTNLGATDFAEHINFRRAMEGELERSVMALSEVERARVHIAFAKDSVFLENREPAKASVMLKLKPTARLSAQNVLAVQHLTASAVEGLKPEAVSVLDMSGELLSRPRRDIDAAAGDSSGMLEYRQSVERDYMAKIKATLDPLLGAEKYRAGVSIDCDFTSGEQSEESFDPNRSVMVNSQRTEDVSSTTATGGVPGTPSNLPRPVPRTGTQGGGVSRKTENTSFQTSRVVRHTKLPQGGVKRVSVSVLLDQGLRWEGTGAKAKRILEPPAPEKLKVVKDVLAGVVGFQQDRGDQILVETLPFEATLALQAPPGDAPAQPQQTQGAPLGGIPLPAWIQPLLQKAPLPVWLGAAGAILVVLLVMLGLIVRKLFGGKKKKKAAAGEVEEGAPAVEGASAAPGALPAAEPQEDFEDRARAMMAGQQAQREKAELEALASLQMPPQTKKAEVLKKVIVDEAKKDPAAIAQLIRTWITEQR